ncbi:MAG: gamma carbonic anhydrase family protein [Chloroflexota bacterium]
MIRSFGGKTPRIAESAFVSEAAYVVGDVEVGENSSIWPGAVVRGDFAPIKVGRNTQIEDNCVVHCGEPLTIGDNVHVGHGVVVHCRRIGSHVLIGNNVTLLDGAEVGDFCLVAAHSVVSRGMCIPDRSFAAGIPAEVRGETTPEQLEMIERGVSAYTALSRQYKAQGL